MNRIKYICIVSLLTLCALVTNCIQSFADNENEGIVINSINISPALFDEYGVLIQWDSCKYTAGASDLTITLEIRNNTGSIIGVSFDDLRLDDSFVEMEFGNSETYDAGTDYVTNFYIDKDIIREIGKEDFDNLYSTVVISADGQKLNSIPIEVRREAFIALEKIQLPVEESNNIGGNAEEENIPSNSSESVFTNEEETVAKSKLGESIRVEDDSLGTYYISIDGLGRFPQMDMDGLECISVRCVIENIDAEVADWGEIGSGNIGGSSVTLSDDEGFSCEFYNMDFYEPDGLYEICPDINIGEKKRAGLTFLAPAGTESFRVTVNDFYIDFKRNGDEFSEVFSDNAENEVESNKDKEELIQQINILENTNKELQEKLNGSNALYITLQNKADKTEAENTELREENTGLSEEKTELTEKNEELTATNTELTGQNEELLTTIENLQNQIDSLQSQLIEKEELESQVKDLMGQVIELSSNAHFYSHSIYENVLYEVDEIKERAVSKKESTNKKSGYHYIRYYDADENLLMSYNTDKERYILYDRLGHEQINVWTKKGQLNVIDGAFEVSYDKNGHIVAVMDNNETKDMDEKRETMMVTPIPEPTVTPTPKPTSTPTPKPTNTPKPTSTPKPKKGYSSSSSKKSSSYSSSSTTGYDRNDPYASARDTDGDGRLTDDEYLAAIGDLAADIATGNYYGDEEITPEMQEFAEAIYGAMQ